MGAMRSRALLSSGLARIADFDLHPRRAVALAQSSARDWENLVRADPGNMVAWNNLYVSRFVLAWALRGMGDVGGGITVLRGALDDEKRAPPSAAVAGNTGFHTVTRAVWEADQGRRAEAHATLALSEAQLERWQRLYGKSTFPGRNAVAFSPSYTSMVLWAEGDFAGARDAARKAVAQVQALTTSGAGQARTRVASLADAQTSLAEALLGLKDLGAAEAAAREAVRLRLEAPRRAKRNKLDLAQNQTLLAIILAREGKLAEARATNEPALAFHRELLRQGSENVEQHVALAAALYAAALASPPQAPGLLPEAKRIMDGVPPQTLKSKSSGRVRDWIVTAMAQKP
jgi:hypothetical protein